MLQVTNNLCFKPLKPTVASIKFCTDAALFCNRFIIKLVSWIYYDLLDFDSNAPGFVANYSINVSNNMVTLVGSDFTQFLRFACDHNFYRFQNIFFSNIGSRNASSLIFLGGRLAPLS